MQNLINILDKKENGNMYIKHMIITPIQVNLTEEDKKNGLTTDAYGTIIFPDRKEEFKLTTNGNLITLNPIYNMTKYGNPIVTVNIYGKKYNVKVTTPMQIKEHTNEYTATCSQEIKKRYDNITDLYCMTIYDAGESHEKETGTRFIFFNRTWNYRTYEIY